MKNLIQEESNMAPGLKLDAQNHHLLFTGNSFPSNATEMYAPVFQWLQDYSEFVKNEAKPGNHIRITIDFQFRYVNSATGLIIRDIIQKSVDISKESSNLFLDVRWSYYEEDVDMKQMGEELAAFFEMDFEFRMFEDQDQE